MAECQVEVMAPFDWPTVLPFATHGRTWLHRDAVPLPAAWRGCCPTVGHQAWVCGHRRWAVGLKLDVLLPRASIARLCPGSIQAASCWEVWELP